MGVRRPGRRPPGNLPVSGLTVSASSTGRGRNSSGVPLHPLQYRRKRVQLPPGCLRRGVGGGSLVLGLSSPHREAPPAASSFLPPWLSFRGLPCPQPRGKHPNCSWVWSLCIHPLVGSATSPGAEIEPLPPTAGPNDHHLYALSPLASRQLRREGFQPRTVSAPWAMPAQLWPLNFRCVSSPGDLWLLGALTSNSLFICLSLAAWPLQTWTGVPNTMPSFHSP